MTLKNKLPFFFIFLFLSISLSAQSYDYLGVIKLNDSSFISYRLTFDKVNDSIKGYSLTDYTGKHETKSNIKGYYDEKNNLLTFSEYDIVYTKSPVVQKDFCFVHFEGKVRNLDRTGAFSGAFKGKYADGSKCLDGEILLNDQGKIAERLAKLDRKIQRTGRIADSVKQKVSVGRVLDTISRNTIAKNENLNIYTRDQKIKLVIYDAGKEDGDQVNLFIDDKPVLENYTVLHDKKILEVRLAKPQTLIRVEAVSEGTSAPNTVRLEVEDTRNFVRTITNLKKGEKAQMTIVKK